jgi:hypothetical protein
MAAQRGLSKQEGDAYPDGWSLRATREQRWGPFQHSARRVIPIFSCLSQAETGSLRFL